METKGRRGPRVEEAVSRQREARAAPRRAAALRRTPPHAAWAGLSGPWKFTAAALKGTLTFPTRSLCASRSGKLNWEVSIFIFLEDIIVRSF